MSAQVALQTWFNRETCVNCGIEFAVPAGWQDKRREDHRNFFCPNGHSQHYTGQSAAEAEAARHKATIARLNEMTAERDALTKKLQRVERGVCPHCNRSFKNLARHMACKHAS